MKRYFTLLLILSGIFWFTSCRKSETPEPAPVPVEHTFIMFGKISGFTDYNIPDAKAAVADGVLGTKQRLLIYNDSEKELYELVYNRNSSTGYSKVSHRKYDSEVSCFNYDRFRQIMTDAQTVAPSAHYGLSVGTHGSGWLPVGFGIGAQAKHLVQPLIDKLEGGPSLTRNINGEINVSDFARMLEGFRFDFIILDQCLMGGVEVVYEMRNTAPYLIVSPAEILAYGFPFRKVLSTIFSDWGNLVQICRDFIDFYSVYPEYPNGTISLIKTSELEPLAGTVNAIIRSGVNSVGQNGLQYFYKTGIFYDFGQYIGELSQNEVLYQIFLYQLSRTIIYKEHTGSFFQNMAINYYSGLTSYVPEPERYPMFYQQYQKTAWYKAVWGGE